MRTASLTGLCRWCGAPAAYDGAAGCEAHATRADLADRPEPLAEQASVAEDQYDRYVAEYGATDWDRGDV